MLVSPEDIRHAALRLAIDAGDKRDPVELVLHRAAAFEKFLFNGADVAAGV